MSRDSVVYQFVPAYAPLHCLLAADLASACSKDLVNRVETLHWYGVITAHTSMLSLHRSILAAALYNMSSQCYW